MLTLMPESAGDLVCLKAAGKLTDEEYKDMMPRLEAVIAEQSEAADKVRGGDEKPIQFLMGQVMRATKGKANPQLVQQLLRERLS